jgi:hypothetical protein
MNGVTRPLEGRLLGQAPFCGTSGWSVNHQRWGLWDTQRAGGCRFMPLPPVAKAIVA